MEIRTERLLLREFRPDDWRRVQPYQSKEAYLRYDPITDRPKEEVKDFVETMVAWSREEPRTKYQLAVTIPGHDVIVGCCGVRRASPDSKDGEICCELDPTYWGFGYAKEASDAVVDFATRELGLRQLRSNVCTDNVRAVTLAKKLGLTFERDLEDPVQIGDEPHPAAIFTLSL